jgi:hypothetical protein
MTSAKKPNDVLFQKLGSTWYVFSEIDNEVIYSTLPEGVDPHSTKLELYHVIEDHMQKISSIGKKIPSEPAV